MSEQLQLRRGTSSQVAAFTGQQGETVMDTTNNRLVLNDGATAGGWAAAKLTEVVTNTRTPVADAAYGALTTDRLIAYTSLTASRVVSLPTSASYPTGTRLLVIDEFGRLLGDEDDHADPERNRHDRGRQLERCHRHALRLLRP